MNPVDRWRRIDELCHAALERDASDRPAFEGGRSAFGWRWAPRRLVSSASCCLVLLLIGIGVVIGGGVSVWASTFAATLLYGLKPHDPVTFFGAVVVLAGVGIAGWLPAWRAARIDPAAVLRES